MDRETVYRQLKQHHVVRNTVRESGSVEILWAAIAALLSICLLIAGIEAFKVGVSLYNTRALAQIVFSTMEQQGCYTNQAHETLKRYAVSRGMATVNDYSKISIQIYPYKDAMGNLKRSLYGEPVGIRIHYSYSGLIPIMASSWFERFDATLKARLVGYSAYAPFSGFYACFDPGEDVDMGGQPYIAPISPGYELPSNELPM